VRVFGEPAGVLELFVVPLEVSGDVPAVVRPTRARRLDDLAVGQPPLPERGDFRPSLRDPVGLEFQCPLRGPLLVDLDRVRCVIADPPLGVHDGRAVDEPHVDVDVIVGVVPLVLGAVVFRRQGVEGQPPRGRVDAETVRGCLRVPVVEVDLELVVVGEGLEHRSRRRLPLSGLPIGHLSRARSDARRERVVYPEST
jgi:hypothetical protein